MIAYSLYVLAYFLSTRLPVRIGSWIAVTASSIKFYVSPRDRRAVLGNLRRILPDAPEKEIIAKGKEVFVNFGRYLYEFFRLKYLRREQQDRYLTIKGLEHVDEALRKGRGVVTVAAHMGNWELGGVFMALLGYPMVAVALPHKHRRVNDLFNRQRQRIGVTVVPSMGVALRRIYQALKSNAIVALVGDRDFAHTGVRMPFLGATKVIPRGPAVLSLRTGAPLIMGFVVRQPDNTFLLEFTPLPDTPQDEASIMAAYTRALEEQIRRYPTQWLMFREYWKE
ncbi:MAG: lysophospholipid acyltransferase family protein [Deltaproteobacteria bacterium]